MTFTRPQLLVVLPALALGLAGCGDSGSGAQAADDGTISILASTNVYGDVAAAVAGDLAQTTSIITSSAQDPHEYEATARDRLAVEDADVVIENGGGYDTFVDTMLDDAGGDPVVLTASEISGLMPGEEDHADEDHGEEDHGEEDHEGHDHVEGFNEHVWYDLHTAEKVAEDLSGQLGELDPDNAAAYESNAADFVAQIEGLERSAEDLRPTAEGRGVAITEPVPLYLLEEVGLDNETPEQFSEAVEEGTDVPPRVLQEMLDLIDGGDVAVLAYNAQTADETTEQVRAAAEDAGIPVVDFTETLPEGMSYVEWQQSNLDDLAAALG